MTRSTVAALAAVVLLATLAAPAAAADLATEVSELKAATQSRIDEIGSPPATKAEKKEAKKLTKAIPRLDKYAGKNDVADFKVLGKATKGIYKSKTQDPTIKDETVDVLEALIDIANSEKGLVEDILEKLLLAKYKAKVQKLIDKADALLATATSLLDPNCVKAHKAILKAWKTFGNALKKAKKYENKGTGSGPGSGKIPDGLSHYDAPMGFTFSIFNDSSKWYFIRDVRFTGEFRQEADGPAAETMNDAGLAALRPDMFVVETFPGGGVDGPSMIGKKYPGDPYPVEHDLKQYVSAMRYELLAAGIQYYFVGSFVLVISDKPNPGGNEKLFTYPITPTVMRTY